VSLQIVVNEFVHRIGLACAVIAILIIPACEGVKRTATRWDQDLQQFFGTAQPEPPSAQLTASPQPDQPAPSSQAALPQQANEPAAEPQPAAEPEPVPAAIASLREAAVGGDAEAQFALGEAYETGELVGPDLAWAARWYGRSAYGGYSEAQYRYARLKMEGRGLPRDREGAYRWLALAARQGHGEAERARAELELSLGIDRLYQERNWVEAFEPTTGAKLPDPPSVEFLQGRLGRLGFDPGPADGTMGPRTVAALESYQTKRGLEPTGRLSESLLESLRAEPTRGG
jgi:TPR repeat protein